MNTFLAVLTGGGIAAVGGLGSGWLNNWMGSQRDERAHAHDQQMARETHARDQQMAREALRQERLDRAYTELGIYLSHEEAWARSVHPPIGPVPVPDPMTDEERWRIETLVTNHGSPEVRQLLDKWGEQRMKIQEADIVITMARESRDPGSLGEKADQEHQALEDYRRALHEAATAIRDRCTQSWRASRRPRWSAEITRRADQGCRACPSVRAAANTTRPAAGHPAVDRQVTGQPVRAGGHRGLTVARNPADRDRIWYPRMAALAFQREVPQAGALRPYGKICGRRAPGHR